MNLCIADNLKVLRQKNGYTLEALAEIISVSRQTVAKWESEDSYPDIINCQKLASLYKISLDELVNKPLHVITQNDFTECDNRICGILELSDKNALTLPQPIMDMFHLHPGEKVLILADRHQGLAIVKCSQFD